MNSNKLENYLKYNLNKYKLINIFNNNLDDIIKIIISALEISLTYLSEIINQIIYYDLYDEVYTYSYDILYNQYIESYTISNIFNIDTNNSIKLLSKCIKISLSFIHKFVIPRRSYKNNYLRENWNNKRIVNQIEFLKNIKLPEQKSDEWYIFRNSTITASNIWKIFISEYTQTQLILEKCEDFNVNKFKVKNLNSPLHWGQKYEPISILYYEYINNTAVSDFGCIPHEKYSFIAASPDGIICDISSLLYGRMLEIKNVVSREITGIPKMEYWIQMQIQMEVCNLNECDFLETKFIEYTNESEYLEDIDFKYKGTFLQYIHNEDPIYIYAPFMLTDILSKEYNDWVESKDNEIKSLYPNIEYVKTIYWKLEIISCVLILRNKYWFNTVLPDIELFWNNLLEEKETGKYKDRIKKKRKLKIEDEKERSDFPVPGCLIDTNKL